MTAFCRTLSWNKESQSPQVVDMEKKKMGLTHWPCCPHFWTPLCHQIHLPPPSASWVSFQSNRDPARIDMDKSGTRNGWRREDIETMAQLERRWAHCCNLDKLGYRQLCVLQVFFCFQERGSTGSTYKSTAFWSWNYVLNLTEVTSVRNSNVRIRIQNTCSGQQKTRSCSLFLGSTRKSCRIPVPIYAYSPVPICYYSWLAARQNARYAVDATDAGKAVNGLIVSD